MFWAALLQILGAVLFAPVSLLVLLLDTAVGQFMRRRPRIRAPESVVITGATGGIGEALALHYARPGVLLGITGRRMAELELVAQACRRKGAEVHLGNLDVTDGEGMERWLHELDARRPVDLIIANAGVTENTTGTARDLVQAARKLFAVNVDGLLNTVLPLLPRMQERKYGQIALLSSIAGLGPLTSSAAYSATKAAVKTYGEALRRNVYRDNVFVTTICPGFVRSPMTDANKGPMVFMVEMDYAVHAIATGLARGDAWVCFPMPTFVLTWLLQRAFPERVQDALGHWLGNPFFGYRRPSRQRTAAQ